MVTTTVERSRVVLEAENKTSRAFRQVIDDVDVLQRRFSGLSLRATSVVAVTGAVAAGLAALTKRAIENADEIGKAADAIGIATDELQEYRFAAERSGVATEQLDSGLQAFTKRLGEVRNNTGTLTTFLAKYDQQLLQSVRSAQSSEQALRLIFRAMADAGTQSDRAALSAAAFGRTAGVRMTNLVRDGADGLDAMRRRAHELGIVLGEDLIRKSEIANDRLAELSDQLGRAGQAFLLNFGDEIVAATEKLEAFIDEAGRVKKLAFAGLFKDVQDFDAEEIENQIRIFEGKAALRRKVIEDQRALNERFDFLVPDALIEANKKDLRQQEEILGVWQARLEVVKRTKDEEGRTPSQGNGTGNGLPPPPPPDPAEARRIQREREASQRMLQALREQNAQVLGLDEELINRRLQAQLDEIDKARLNDQDALEARLLAEQTAAAELAEIRKTAQQQIEDDAREHYAALERQTKLAAAANKIAWESGLRGQLQVTGTILGQLASLQQAQSKKMFQVGKAAAIAEAVIRTYEAANKAYAAMAAIPVIGPGLGAAAAAAAIAAGLANVQAIKAQQFGGGSAGSPAAPLAVTPTGAPAPPPDITQAGPARPLRQAPREINLTIQGNGMFSAEQIREDLIPLLNEAIGDGVTINSR